MPPLAPSPNKSLVIVLVVLAFVGFIDAAYLTVYHYLGEVVPCALVSGCEVVTTSKYATLGPVPIALLGAVYYAGLLLAALTLLAQSGPGLIRGIRLVAGVGFAATLYLIYLQAFVLDAFCLYCLVSAVTTTAIFAVSFFLKHGTISATA